ncbi:MAG TPA: hypothetical protein VMU45_13535 [Candidatus Eisenbacteria bacterium]|nr:hypothetical protein [Candidatus Eisenbacteria bacterium]
MSNFRPAGVTAITALCLILAITSLVFATLIAAGQIPLSRGAFLLGGGLEQLGPIAFLSYAVLLLLLVPALWKRWRWARRATILVAVAGIALAVPAISSAVMDSRFFAIAREGLQIIIRVLIVFYLSQEPVRDWFTSRSVERE